MYWCPRRKMFKNRLKENRKESNEKCATNSKEPGGSTAVTMKEVPKKKPYRDIYSRRPGRVTLLGVPERYVLTFSPSLVVFLLCLPLVAIFFSQTETTKYGAHGGIKFTASARKETIVKPFSFDTRPKANKGKSVALLAKTTGKVTGANADANNEKTKERLQARKGFQRGIIARSSKENKVMAPDLNENIDKRISANDGETIINIASLASDVASSLTSNTMEKQRLQARKGFQRGTSVRSSKENKVTAPDLKENTDKRISANDGETKINIASLASDVAASLTSNTLPRSKYGAHSGLKLNPNVKKTTKIKPFSFEARSTVKKQKTDTVKEQTGEQVEHKYIPKRISERRNAVD